MDIVHESHHAYCSFIIFCFNQNDYNAVQRPIEGFKCYEILPVNIHNMFHKTVHNTRTGKNACVTEDKSHSKDEFLLPCVLYQSRWLKSRTDHSADDFNAPVFSESDKTGLRNANNLAKSSVWQVWRKRTQTWMFGRILLGPHESTAPLHDHPLAAWLEVS